MTPEEFQQTEAVFQAACALPVDERISFIDERCAGDPRMRSRVVRLLKHDESPAAGLEQQIGTAVRAVSDVLLQKKSTPMPLRIGAYRIIRQLGEGGFGVVYLAEQENPRRTVALKVVRWMMASQDAVARFEHEAHVLGQLQHAGIAQIFEAGIADAEFDPAHTMPLPPRMPYYTMEYVQGKNLIEYANASSPSREPLDINERLELIARVCDALQHAHQNGIIHRDLKPDNILVVDSNVSAGLRSASGTRLFGAQPKLLDFGVARALEPDDAAGATRTHVGQIVGTPAYMSPEQVRGEPHRVDIRSDVYAIGVLLYQLVSGRLPYDFPSSRMAEIARVIELQPPTPIRTGGTTRAARINPDVEAIIAKSLAKEPERRYQSAAALASDIRRFLADEPIEAKRDSALYLLRKNAKRYRAALSVAAGFVILIAGFAVWATSQARANRRLAVESIVAKNEAISERDRANSTAHQLVLEVAQSNIERGKTMGQAGNFSDAERLIWGEYLRNPNSTSATWGLREFYASFPNLASMHSDIHLIRSMALSPDEKILAIGGTGRKAEDIEDVEIWDLTQRKRIRKLTGRKGLTDLKYSPDGKYLACGSNEVNFYVWDTETWEMIYSKAAHRPRVISLSFVKDHPWFVTVGSDHYFKVWKVGEAKYLAAIHIGKYGATRVRISDDGKLIAAALADGSIRVWRTEPLWQMVPDKCPASRLVIEPPEGSLVAAIKAHGDRIQNLAFSPDSKYIVSAGSLKERSLRRWNIETQACEATSALSIGVIDALCFAPDGKTIFAGGWFSVDELNTADMQRNRRIFKGKCTAALMADGARHLIMSTDQDIRIWNVSDSAGRVDLGPDSGCSVAYDPAGKYLATCHEDGIIDLRDATDGTIVKKLVPDHVQTTPDPRTYRVRALTFDAAGRHVYGVSRGSIMRKWSVDTFTCDTPIKNVNHVTHQSVAFSPDSTLWCYADRARNFHLCKTDSDKAFITLPAGGTEALSICFSPDSQMIATVGRDHSIDIWSRDGKIIREIPAEGSPWGLAFTHDNKKIIAGSWRFTIETWEISTGERTQVLEGHSGTVWSVQVKPDEPDIIASCSSDGTVRLWSLSDGRNLATLELCPETETMAASFSPEGRYLAAACSDNVVRIWDLEFADSCIKGNLENQMRQFGGREAMKATTTLPATP